MDAVDQGESTSPLLRVWCVGFRAFFGERNSFCEVGFGERGRICQFESGILELCLGLGFQ